MNGVFVLFDCLPSRALGCYGNLRAETPAFNRLAASSVVFDQHVADVFPTERDAFCARMAESLRTAGIEVAEVRDEPSRPGSAVDVAPAIFDRLRASERPWLLQVQSRGLASGAGAETLLHSAADLDRSLRSLVDAMGARDDETLLIVAGLRGLTSQRADLPEGARRLLSEQIQTPLFVRMPRSRWGTRRQSLAALSDLLPTFWDWFSLPAIAPVCEGVSLLSVIRDSVRSTRERVTVRAEDWGCVRTPQWHLIAPTAVDANGRRTALSDGALLFRKPEDAWDVLNGASQSPDVVDELVESLSMSLQNGRHRHVPQENAENSGA